MRATIITLLTIVLVLLIGYFSFYYFMMRNVKEPRYTVVSKSGPIEIRQYAPMLIAEVTTTGNRDQSIRKGFRLLADFIFGNNISMTAPVAQQRSAKIQMTAPVIQTPTADKTWSIRFVMPEKYTLETLPKPKNPKIKIVQQAALRMIAIRFSGSITAKNLETQTLITLFQNFHKFSELAQKETR